MVEAVLADEREYFDAHRGELLKAHAGKYALIKARALVGIFDTPEAAYEAGVNEFGNVPMLIVQISAEDVVVSYPALQLGLIGGAVQV